MNLPVRYALALAAALVLLASCGSESEPPAKATPSPTIGASHRGDIDVLGAVLVMNDDGSATLSAQIVNHTDFTPYHVDVSVGEEIETRYFQADEDPFKPNQNVAVGGESDPVRIRFMDISKPGADLPPTLPLRLQFSAIHDLEEDSMKVNLEVPVVERSPRYDDVAGNKPNTAIEGVGAKIVVVPGQKKAYVGGSLTATITDNAYELPTAVDADGDAVEYRHQTATGGPYGMHAEAGKTVPFGGPPYVVPASELDGDADYFNAADVTVGETITVTIPFQSGDVIVPFTVVAG